MQIFSRGYRRTLIASAICWLLIGIGWLIWQAGRWVAGWFW